MAVKPSVQNLNVVVALDGLDKFKVTTVNEDNRIQYLFRFGNGFGASVIWLNYDNAGSYGYEKGMWELALIKWLSADDYDLVYDSRVYSDVRGHLTNADVLSHLKRIKKLPPNHPAH